MSLKKTDAALKAAKEARALKQYNICKKFAECKGGKLLTPIYSGSHVPHQWQCQNGHTWKARPSNIKTGHWCPFCAGVRIEDPHERLVLLAANKGGLLVTPTYLGGNTKHTWQCDKGHQWNATPGHIKSGTWCPTCGEGLQERLTRHAVESLFGQPFDKIRPKWLINHITGRTLELDCYNADLKLALEYQGEQHYRIVPGFKSTKDSLYAIQQRDQVKREICLKRGIILVEVPYSVKAHDFPQFIYEAVCILAPHLTPLMLPCKSVVMANWIEASEGITIQDLQMKAVSHGGICLSSSYLGYEAKHQWQCKDGHQWKAAACKVLQRTWCPQCANQRQKALLDQSVHGILQDLAASKGGKLLTPTYLGARYNHTWICRKNHKWEATPDNVRTKGTWCSICVGKTLIDPLGQLQKLAKDKGGILLSPAYKGDAFNLTWRCQKGHQWQATPSNVKRGTWCPICGGSKSLTLAILQDAASLKGGRCLSTTYINTTTKYTWQCKVDHQWQATASSIRKGSWCPQCAGRKPKLGASLSDSHAKNEQEQ